MQVAAAQGSPKYGGTFVVAQSSENTQLNFLLTTSAIDNWLMNQMSNSLVDIDYQLNPVPELAESWEISEDGTQYTFYLEPNVKFHDGTPLTAETVKWSYDQNWLWDLPRSKAWQDVVKPPEENGIEVIDERTVRFNLKQAFPPFFILNLALWRGKGVLPQHILEDLFAKGQDMFENDFNLAPIGTGPFKFKEWIPGDRIVLEKFEDYFRPDKPYLDRIIVKYIPDYEGQLTALEAGDVDFVGIYPGIAEIDAQRFGAMEGFAISRSFTASGPVQWMGYNREFEPFGKLEVRQAIQHAVDRQEIIDIANLGVGNVQHSFISSLLTKWHNPNVPKYEHDITKAKQLLDDAGYSEGFSVKLLVQTGTASVQVAEVVKAQLKEVGIDVTLEIVEYAVMRPRVTTNYDFEMVMWSHSTGPDPAWMETYWYPGAIKPGTYQFTRYDNQEFADLWDQQMAAPNDAERKALLAELQVIHATDLPACYLFEQLGNPYAYSTKYTNLDFEFQGPYSPFHPLEDVWWVEGEPMVNELPFLGAGIVTVVCSTALIYYRTRKK